MVNEPLDPAEVKRLIRDILEQGIVRFSRHSREEMGNDRLVEQDVKNVLRGGWVKPGEWENGTWRYQVCTHRIVVVVAFPTETTLVVVTAWRLT